MTATKESRIWDRFAKGYAKRPVADEDSYQKKLAMTRERLRPDMTIFEFGCGTGSTALTHAPYVSQVIATDISPKMIEIAQEKARAAGVENVRFETVDISGYTAPEEGFDMVLGLSILHLTPNRDEVIAKAAAMLKPGGWFVTSTICLADGLSMFKPIVWLGRAVGYLPSIAFFTQDALVAAMEAAGLEIEERWSPGPKKALFLIARKPG